MRMFLSIFVSAFLGICSTAMAYDFSRADNLFEQRGQGVRKIAQARSAYERALRSTRGMERVHAVEKLARLAFFEGDLLKGEEDDDGRKPIFKKCLEYVEKISPDKVGETPQYHYWKASCMALWGRSAGLSAALGQVGKFKKALKKALEYRPSYDGGGIYRITSGVYMASKWLRVVGLYDLERSKRYADLAVSIGPQYYNAYLIKANVLKRMDRIDEAIELIENKKSELEALRRRRRLPRGLGPESVEYLRKMRIFLRDN